MDSLTRLEGLHQDLAAFANSSLVNVERLWQELEASIQEFRDFLDKAVPDTDPAVSISNGLCCQISITNSV